MARLPIFLVLVLMLVVVCSCTQRSDISGGQVPPNAAEQHRVGEVAMKEVSDSAGLIHFWLPAHWREELEEDGTSMFYSEEPGSGTLRLTVLTGRAPTDVNADTPKRLLESVRGSGQIDELSETLAISSFRKTATEDGESLVVYYWELAHATPPDRARVAIFSFTILADQEADPVVKRDLLMLKAEIRNARFSSFSGDGVR